jgi:hypothetical protein
MALRQENPKARHTAILSGLVLTLVDFMEVFLGITGGIGICYTRFFRHWSSLKTMLLQVEGLQTSATMVAASVVQFLAALALEVGYARTIHDWFERRYR